MARSLGRRLKGIVRWLVAAAAVVLIVVTAGTLIPRPLLPAERAAAAAETRRILLLANPIHTDIAIPLDDETRTAFAFLAAHGLPVNDPAARWLIFGWGGRAFYIETPTWADLKPVPVFRALTLDRSVMHVDIVAGIDEGEPSVTGYELDAAQFRGLSDFIDASFVRTSGDVAVVPDAGYGNYDQFFEANGSFNALLGCNTWTARALRAAGLRTGLWNPLPQTLALSLALFN